MEDYQWEISQLPSLYLLLHPASASGSGQANHANHNVFSTYNKTSYAMLRNLLMIIQMYIIRLKQAGLEFQYTQGQCKIPLTLANIKDLLPWTKTFKLIYWYPGWESGVI